MWTGGGSVRGGGRVEGCAKGLMNDKGEGKGEQTPGN